MDLNEFVSETLTQIFTGVQAAQNRVKEAGGKISPSQTCKIYGKDRLFVHVSKDGEQQPLNNIEFDVALTTVEASGSEGKAGLTVWGMGAGVSGKTETSNSTVSRIKFSVPVVLPQSS